MKMQMKSVWPMTLTRAGLVMGVMLVLAGTAALGQIRSRNFGSAAPSRVVPAENVVPLDEQEPTPAQPLRPSAPRPIRVDGERLRTADASAAPRGGDFVPADSAAAPSRALLEERSARQEDVIPVSDASQGRSRPQGSELLKEPATLPAKGAKPEAAKQDSNSKDTKTEDSKKPGEPKEGVDLVKGEVQQVWEKVIHVWQYPFFKTKDFELSLQVVIGGLVLLWVGHKLARRLSIWLGETILRRVGLPPATSAPLQKMSFYILFGLFAVFSLQLVGVPMTVFTFFGGALAIGIGFGSQNVMNNFISGLILLIERPIRVGDVIQIDSHSGKVSEIGARSTRVTTGANLEVIIPNSTFLQGNVVNWTLSDDVVSSKVTVGVAYGSPAREVARLLKQAAEEHDKILKTPGPGVSFTDFAADSMQFELSFWLKMSQADRGRVESDLRFKIDELFADRGIVIAYPQRDVHLNLMRPVEVRLTEPSASPRELRGAA